MSKFNSSSCFTLNVIWKIERLLRDELVFSFFDKEYWLKLEDKLGPKVDDFEGYLDEEFVVLVHFLSLGVFTSTSFFVTSSFLTNNL